MKKPLFLLMFLLLSRMALGAPAGEVAVENFHGGETLRYPVALIRGTLTADAPEVVVENRSSRLMGRRYVAKTDHRRFKALIQLTSGENRIQFRAKDCRLAALNLTYQPATTNHIVRIIYMTDEAGDTHYDSQYPNDKYRYADKLDTAAKLMQTLTAERLNDLGYGRKTFTLELDSSGKTIIHQYKAKKAMSYYHTRTGDQLWYEFLEELEKPFPTDIGKNVVIMAFTRWDPKTKKVGSHTALGGAGLGLFGSADLFSWPNSLQEVPSVFESTVKVDTSRVLDDSAYRGTIWGLASTTMGATLHEMGHTFGLPHSTDPYSIMSRGFDRFNRVFTLVEPPSKVNPQPIVFKQEETAYFDKPMADILVKSPWFQSDR